MPFQLSVLLWKNLHWRQNYVVHWCPFFFDIELGDIALSIGRDNKVAFRARVELYVTKNHGLSWDYDQYKVERFIKHGYGLIEPLPYELAPKSCSDEPF